MTPHNQNGMHPKDMRNLMIFLACAAVLWFGFDHFVLKPQMEAAKRQQAAGQQTLAAQTAQGLDHDPINTVPRSRDEIISEGARLPIESAQLNGTLSLTGARIDDLEFKNYFTEIDRKTEVPLFAPAGSETPYYAEMGWLAENTDVKVPTSSTVWTAPADAKLTTETPVTLTWNNSAGLVFERTLAIDPEYLITVTQSVKNTSGKPVTLFPYAAITRKGTPKHSSTVGYEGPLGYVGEDLHQIKYTDLTDDPAQSFTGSEGWIGIGDKYWLASIIPDQKSNHTFRFAAQVDAGDEEKEHATYQVDARGDGITIADGASGENVTHLYAGAKKVSVLELYETKLGVKHFDLAVDFGMLYFLTRPMYWLLTLFNSWVGNFGLAIIMLTIVVRFAVFPLTSASYKSFAKMKKVAPRMTELKVKYGDDKARMQQELVKLYETERVNPMAGCFPLLLQIPIFFAVYKVISVSIEMRHAPFFGWIHDLSAKDPLSVFNLFGLLPFHVPEVMHIGPWSIAMLILMLMQKHLNPPPTDQIQKDIANFMPWVITFVLSKFPVGLVIYWTFSNLISFTQQYIIMRSMGVPVYLFAKEAAIAHHASHSANVEEAAKRAKEEREERDARKKRAEGVEESLFGDQK